jgi:Flp pilus assembly protein TadG
MTAKQRPSEEGHTLVMVAMLMAILMTFAALTIDCGRVYLERRSLQHAADSAALAGARAICSEDMTYEQAKTQAEQQARQNVPHPEQAEVLFPPAEAGIMKVTVQGTARTTFFATVAGLDEVTLDATAAAECGPANTVCGLYPKCVPAKPLGHAEEAVRKPALHVVWIGK